MNRYRVKNAAGDLMVTGTVKDCAAALGVLEQSFRVYLYRLHTTGFVNRKYIIEEDQQ